MNPAPPRGIANTKLDSNSEELEHLATYLLDRLYYEHLSYYRDPFAAGVKVPEPGRDYFAQLRYSF